MPGQFHCFPDICYDPESVMIRINLPIAEFSEISTDYILG